MVGSKLHRLTGGLILITLGVLIYLSKAGIYSFGKTWPILIIVIGISHNYSKSKRFWRLVYHCCGSSIPHR